MSFSVFDNATDDKDNPKQTGNADNSVAAPNKDYLADYTDSDSDDDDDEFEEVPPLLVSELEDNNVKAATECQSDDSMPEIGTVEFTMDDGDDVMSPKRRKLTVSNYSRGLRVNQHIIELICMLTSGHLMNHACNTDEAIACALSLVPAYVVQRINEHIAPNKPVIRREWFYSDLQYAINTFRGFSFKIRQSKKLRGRDIESNFFKLLETRTITMPWHRSMLLTAMLRALTFEVRLCMAISPLPLKLTAEESAMLEGKNAIDQSPDKREQKKGNVTDPMTPQYWCEVFNRVNERWVSVNPESGQINELQDALRGRRTSKGAGSTMIARDFAYIIGFDSQGYARDVTRRYSADFINKTRRLRLESVSKRINSRASTWWDQWIKRWEDPTQSERDYQESEEMEKKEIKSTMPKRISDFAKNPYYVLERNLKQNEIIYPEKPIVGTIRGELIYLRKNVKTVRSSMAWRREGRIVKPNERPARLVKQRAVTARTKMAVDAIEAEGKDASSELYGEWQTELFRAPPVVDGIVPRNEYGRVDLFKQTMLPPGGVHIQHPDAWKVCKTLGIDYADAVTGFEFRKGVSTPIINGVVVPKCSEDLVLDALRESARVKIEEAASKATRRSVKNWRHLLVALRIREEVEIAFKQRSSRTEGITFRSRKGKEHENTRSQDSDSINGNDDDEDSNYSDNTNQDTGGGFVI